MGIFTTTRLISFDKNGQSALDRIAKSLETLTQQKERYDMAVIQEVATLVTQTQALVALVNQLIAKIGTPSPDVSDTAAAANSELSAVNAAIQAAQAALTPPPQT